MKLLFAQEKIQRVADRWLEQYPPGHSPLARGVHASEIHKQLAALKGGDLTPDAVAAIIGNKSWSHYSCSECNGDFERVVEIDNYDSGTRLCASCARAIAALASVQLP